MRPAGAMPPRDALALAGAAVAGAAAALLASQWIRRGRAALALPHHGGSLAAATLTAALWATIPLSSTMAVRCSSFPGSDAEPLQLAAPLEPLNRNVHGTAFAGSLYAAAVLCGWAWAEAHASRSGGELARATLVVKAASIRYRAPLRSDFVCVAHPPGAAALRRFAAEFARDGKATLALRVALWPQEDAHAGAALAALPGGDEAAGAGADVGALAVLATPDGRKPACILDGEFTAFT